MLCHPVQRRDDLRCQYCGKDGLASLDNWHDLTIEYVRPQRHGGSDEPANLVASCSHCNSIKGDRWFESFEEARQYVLKRRQELQRSVGIDPPPEQFWYGEENRKNIKTISKRWSRKISATTVRRLACAGSSTMRRSAKGSCEPPGTSASAVVPSTSGTTATCGSGSRG